MARSTEPASGSAQANWRGIKLSPQQEFELSQYCLSESHGVPYGEHGKHFWVEISKACPVLIGRPYSWQSCRRSALAWEQKNVSTEVRPSDSPVDRCDSDSRQIERSSTSEAAEGAGVVPQTPPESHSGPQTPQAEVESGENEENEDDMLPDQSTPLLTRKHKLSALKKADSQMSNPKISAMATGWLANWEIEVNNITGILEENQNPIYRKRILRAFSALQNEMQASIRRYEDRAGDKS